MTSRIDDLDNAEELWKTSPALKDEPKPLSQQGRVRSWEKVVVFVEANDALYIAEKDRIRGKCRQPRGTHHLTSSARFPKRNTLATFGPE